MNVADAAVEAGAGAIVMISTDKAIDPVSMLGATKRFAEMYAQALDAEFMGRNGATRIIAVRFGNVLGSVGSVVPKFKAQIARGGPVTVTHPDMVRYFMTTREAADLVLTSASHAEESRAATERTNGDERASVYVLKMGQPVRIYELAERMIRLAGYEPGEDIEIAVTGHAARRAPARDPLRPRGAAHRDRHRRRHGRQARLRRPRPGRPVAPGPQPAIREGDRLPGGTGVRGGDPGVQAPEADAPACRASAASASRVELTGCQPRSFRACGARHERARQPLIGLPRPASAAAPFRTKDGTGISPGPRPSPCARP